MNLIRYISVLLRARKEINKQRKWNRTFLMPYMRSLEQKYNDTFPPEQENKILNYYSLFIPSILCNNYKKLYGEKLTDEERKRVSLFGILTPIGDDLFDIDKLDAESIHMITFAPGEYEARTFSSSVAKEIQHYLLQNVLHKNEYIESAKNVLEIQLETIKQTNPSVSDKEIETITYAKGGYSVIIYHQVLNTPASEQMLKVLFYIGSLMQLANDCFDISKDVNDGIFTLANRCNDYRSLKKLYFERVKETNRLIMALPYSKSKKEEFTIMMHLITARAFVAIDQLITLQDKLGAPLNCLKLERKQLVCDMQKPKNIIRWMIYAYKLPSLK